MWDEIKEYDRLVATVMLNYNSEKDVMISAPQLLSQAGVNQVLILIDNASQRGSVELISHWLKEYYPSSVIGGYEEVQKWVGRNIECARKHGRIFFILNDENGGYSAGNNVGIRLADELGADAVLIVNPDMRINNVDYVSILTRELFFDEKNYAVGSRILGMDGREQSPLREPEFWEELFWLREYIPFLQKKTSYIIDVPCDAVRMKVPKVSGCCLMLSMDFLKKIGLLDQNVFLYCEEPILASQINRSNGQIMFVPTISAIHAHARSEKGNSSQRMLVFIKSRLYYLDAYSGYGGFKIFLLKLSYYLLSVLHKIKLAVQRWRGI